MKPTIKITFDSEGKKDEVLYISYEDILEMINKKDVDIIDVEIFR